MKANIPIIPWHSMALWQEADNALQIVLHHQKDRLAEAISIAQQIQLMLTSTFRAMDQLCRDTCPDCMDNCCRRATIWFDFKDLLFLHLAEIPLPQAQTISRPGETCRYLPPAGCRLDRIQRPFVCTWYICPAQNTMLKANRQPKQVTDETIQRIKALRKEMETIYIRATA